MIRYVEIVKKLTTPVQYDDFADRLSRFYTVAILVVFDVVISSSELVGINIACWCPAHFTGSMVAYTNYLCWIASTYYVPSNEHLPTPSQPRRYRINYYQWVPFILALMACLFYIPSIVWRLASRPSGLDAKTVMQSLHQTTAQFDEEKREKMLLDTCKLFDRALDYRCSHVHKHSWYGVVRRRVNRLCLPGFRSGSYVIALYMCVKCLYVLNVCVQFFLLNAFLGAGYHFYGLEGEMNFWESSRFPRVTMCDYIIRTLGENNQRHTVQCTLPINLFNEKIFAFIWFWLCLVALVSTYSLFNWLSTLTKQSRLNFIRRHLKTSSDKSIFSEDSSSSGDVQGRNRGRKRNILTIDEKLLESFVFDYLQQDGIFLLRVVKKNANDMVVSELVCKLWEQYKRNAHQSTANNNKSFGGSGDDESQQQTFLDKTLLDNKGSQQHHRFVAASYTSSPPYPQPQQQTNP